MNRRAGIRLGGFFAALCLALSGGVGAAYADDAPPDEPTPAEAAAVLAAVGAVEPTGVITPMSASGYALISAFTYSWEGLPIPVASGYLRHDITGSGLNFSFEGALYTPSLSVPGAIWGSNVCGWRIDFVHIRSSDSAVTTSRGPVGGCNIFDVKRERSGSFTASAGSQCAVLYIAGVERGRQCHTIKP